MALGSGPVLRSSSNPRAGYVVQMSTPFQAPQGIQSPGSPSAHGSRQRVVAASKMDGTRSQSPDSWAVSSSGSGGSNPCGTPAQAASPQTGEADAKSGRSPDRRSRSRSRGRPGSAVIMRADRGLAVGPYSRTAEQPPTIPGCEWWQAPLWTAHEGQRIKLPARPLRPIRYESLCSGTLGELVGFKATPHPPPQDPQFVRWS